MFLPGCTIGCWRYPEMRIINIFLTEEEVAAEAAKWRGKWWRRRWWGDRSPGRVAENTASVEDRKPDC